MKLGMMIGYNATTIDVQLDLVKAAEALGYDSVWTAEIYGSDAMTPLAYLAAHTSRIRLGTGVVQLAARTPANCAMAIATIDQLAGGGRAMLGIGVSGPQIVEGWYGQPWGSPVTRLRDYVTIVQKILRREVVSHDGPEISLPYSGPGNLGQGKPLKLILHPPAKIPIYLGCGGPASVALMAELTDGWLPMGLTTANWDTFAPSIERGLSRTPGKSLADLDICHAVDVEITDDVAGAIEKRKAGVAMRVGGYGSNEFNFHLDAMVRRGFQDEADKIQHHFLRGERDLAIAAVPNSYIEESALIGPEDRIRERYRRYNNSPVTSLRVVTDKIETLELMADIAGAPSATTTGNEESSHD